MGDSLHVGYLAKQFSAGGAKVHGTSSQTGWTFQYGYAKLWLSAAVERILEGISQYDTWEPIEGVVISVRYQKEGEGQETTTIDLSGSNWWDTLQLLGREVFATGRTKECGLGAGLKSLPEITRGMKMCDHRLSSLHSLLYPEDEPPLDLDPEYQRDHVWTDEQASSFVGYFVHTATLGSSLVPLIFINREEPYSLEVPDEVIDGKQRLTALRRWLDGHIPAQFETLGAVWYKDTNEIERRCLPTIKIAYVSLDQENVLKFYLLLNAGGTAHTEKEISRVQSLLEDLQS